ncbi:arginine--tRNA ligase [Bdellovibrio sp. 22V]|uniref:arginine--tRNA ligase n=1 Tax=Bdellovibrio TaxID=958 RepID=UPI002542B145|nr:arginine--tRNA ligase [Bdellovibrio sp. 22V]WII71051.1 arginine--tRNA ligase [Bdellovibrio sp. 22V]
MRLLVSQKIQNAAKALSFEMSLEEIYKSLGEPPNPDMGDLTFGCFILAKALKKAPPMIAAELAKNIPSDENIAKAEPVGPYLNITFTSQSLGKNVIAPMIDGSHFKKELISKSPRSMIEFSQPNTHKELHVGHMRNLCLGDALIRMLRYCGRDVVSCTFPGDVGTHVAKCLWYMQKHNSEPIPETGKGEWLGRMYSKGNMLLEDQLGTDLEEKNRQELTLILRELESKQGEYYELWKTTRQWSIDLMQEVYKWADVKFDIWYWESDVDSASVKWAQQLYKEGKLVQSNGAIGMDLEAEGLGFCLLLKSDGNGLYATKDIELARRKFQENGIEKSIYVVDVRQALHFKQVFKVLEKLGFEQAKDCFHLQYNFVELPDGAMSSRKGNIVPIMDLIQRMEEHVKTNYLSRYENEWSKQEIQEAAEKVAKGAIRYGMLRMDTNKKIVFDLNEWLRLDGESGPFVQYSYARIASLGRKFNFDPKASVQWDLLTHKAEHHLMQSLMNFNSGVALASENYKPAALCTYLYELAKKFNVFYHECPIGTAEDEKIKQARLALSHAVGVTLKQGMALLGIPAPEKM